MELVRGRAALVEWMDLGGEDTRVEGLDDRGSEVEADGAGLPLCSVESCSKIPLRLVRVEDFRGRLRIEARSSVVVVRSRG